MGVKMEKLMGYRQHIKLVYERIRYLRLTGYIRGGCSPIGQKKEYKTFIHESCKGLDFIIVSAGKIGYQIKINPNDLINVVSGKVEYIIK